MLRSRRLSAPPRLDLLRRRRQADEIEIKAPNELSPVGLRRERQSLCFQRSKNETVHRRANKFGVFDRGQRRTLERKKGPVLPILIGDDHFRMRDRSGGCARPGPFRAGIDPPFQQIDLLTTLKMEELSSPRCPAQGGDAARPPA